MFKKMPKIMPSKDILNKAFSRARKTSVPIDKRRRVDSVRDREIARIDTASQVITSYLDKILSSTPNVEGLSPFYIELVSAIVDRDQLKKSLGAVRWARDMTSSMQAKYKRKIKGTSLSGLAGVRSEFYGRVSSVLKQIDKDFKFLEDARHALKRMPKLKNLPTIVIAGCPNAGKSSLLRALTGAEPQIRPYPFTTTGLLVGYIEERIQIIDSPGLLERPFERSNQIEQQTLLALKHIAGRIVFVFDPSEHSGYSIDEQLSLYKDIKQNFDVPFIVCINKTDIPEASKGISKIKKNIDETPFLVSAKNEEGIDSLRKALDPRKKRSRA